MIVILYILFKNDQNKVNTYKKKAKRWNSRLQAIEQRLEDSFSQNKDKPEEFNPESTTTAQKVVPDEKNPIEKQYIKLRVETIFDATLEQCHTNSLCVSFMEFEIFKYIHMLIHYTIDMYSEFHWAFALNSEKDNSYITNVLEMVAIIEMLLQIESDHTLFHPGLHLGPEFSQHTKTEQKMLQLTVLKSNRYPNFLWIPPPKEMMPPDSRRQF